MTLNMTPSPWLYTFLKQYERFRPTAYLPTPNDKWTIGYGHTGNVHPSDTCTMAQALEWLEDDVAGAALEVCSRVTVPLNQCQFDALVSLVFRCGPAPLEKTLGHLLNSGDYAGAAAQFKRWDYQQGQELAGLKTRANAEAAHFLTPDANA